MSALPTPFWTTADLKNLLLSNLGYNIDITQLTAGSLEGSFRLKKVGELFFINIRSNQALLFFGTVHQLHHLAADEGQQRPFSAGSAFIATKSVAMALIKVKFIILFLRI